mmetsp:Transcript_24056/g.33633  ORF Transcript_24056/g.33633 Transcript_24056/m.33633 type:complete len:459 (+) Transcript_24056:52-1428(+)
MRRCGSRVLKLRPPSFAYEAGRRQRFPFSTFTIADIPEVKEAKICAERGDWGGALQLLDRASMVLSSVPEMKMQTMSRAADIHQKQGDISKEISERQRILQLAAESGSSQYVPLAAKALSIALLRGGELDKAVMHNIEALQDVKNQNSLIRMGSQLVTAVILTHHPRRSGEVLGIIDGVVAECSKEGSAGKAQGEGEGSDDQALEMEKNLAATRCVGELVRVRYYHHSQDSGRRGIGDDNSSQHISAPTTAAAAAGTALAEAHSLLEGHMSGDEALRHPTLLLLGVSSSLGELSGVCLAARGSCYGVLEDASIALEETCLNKAIKRFEAMEEEGGEKGSLYLANALRSLAKLRGRKGDGVVAEGLFRSVLSKLNQFPKSILEAELRIATLRDYAALLEKMEWNGRSRKPEGDKLFLEASATEQEMFKEKTGENTEPHNIHIGSITDQWLLNAFGRMPF